AGIGWRIFGIFLNCLVAIADGREQIIAGATKGIGPTLGVVLKSFGVLRGTLRELLFLGARQLQAQLLRDLFRYLFLHCEHIGKLAIVLLAPNLAVILRIDELHTD